jgi:peptidoglycan/xylan/chitin deacetylase (PgdA/CDA1 family)
MIQQLPSFPSYSLHKSECTIFLFHGVVRENNYSVRNYIRKHIEADYFRNFLSDLISIGTPITMDDVVSYHKNKTAFPEFSFVITFDDGFENNYSVACPILEEFNLPATFYLTTNWIDKNQMAWVDKIEYCLESISSGSFYLSELGQDFSFTDTNSKISVLKSLREIIKGKPGINTIITVSEVFKQCKMREIEDSQDPLDLKLSWAQVKEISENNKYIVAAHTHNHPIMSFMNMEQCEYEIRTSIDILENLCGSTIKHFAYPDGQSHHYNKQVIDLLKKSGIECCPTAVHGTNSISTDLFELKRIMVT